MAVSRPIGMQCDPYSRVSYGDSGAAAYAGAPAAGSTPPAGVPLDYFQVPARRTLTQGEAVALVSQRILALADTIQAMTGWTLDLSKIRVGVASVAPKAGVFVPDPLLGTGGDLLIDPGALSGHLDAVVFHELVHAAQHQRHPFITLQRTLAESHAAALTHMAYPETAAGDRARRHSPDMRPYRHADTLQALIGQHGHQVMDQLFSHPFLTRAVFRASERHGLQPVPALAGDPAQLMTDARLLYGL